MEPAEILASAIQLANSEGSDDSHEYWELVRTLHNSPEQQVFDLVATCARAATATERSVAADVLAQLGRPDETGKRPFTDRSAPILRALLLETDEDVLTSAIYALGHHSIATAADLQDLARHNAADVRYAVAFSLGGRTKNEQRLLLELMRDVDADVRDWATFAIGSLAEEDTPEIRNALKSRLDDSDDNVRGEAMVGLARRGDPEVIEMIVAGLNSEANYLVKDAAELILEHFPNETRVRDALSRCTPVD